MFIKAKKDKCKTYDWKLNKLVTDPEAEHVHLLGFLLHPRQRSSLAITMNL